MILGKVADYDVIVPTFVNTVLYSTNNTIGLNGVRKKNIALKKYFLQYTFAIPGAPLLLGLLRDAGV